MPSCQKSWRGQDIGKEEKKSRGQERRCDGRRGNEERKQEQRRHGRRGYKGRREGRRGKETVIGPS